MLFLGENDVVFIVDETSLSLSMCDDKATSCGICFSSIVSLSFFKVGEFVEKSHLIASTATSGELNSESALSTIVLLSLIGSKIGVRPPKTILLREELFGVVIGDKPLYVRSLTPTGV